MNVRNIIIILVLVFAVFGFLNNKSKVHVKPKWVEQKIADLPFEPTPNEPEKIKLDFSAYSCQGKTHCSHMSGCEEAIFYLRNCPNQHTDGNGDGCPCERQWCGTCGEYEGF